MKKVQARLDPETKAALDWLVQHHGWSTSRVIREAIRYCAKHKAASPPQMIGIGIVASGVPDRGSNKKYLEGFGSNSGIGKKRVLQPKRRAS